MSSDLNARMGGEEQARGNSKGDAVHENNSVDDSSLYEPEPDTIHELTGYVDKLQSQVKRWANHLLLYSITVSKADIRILSAIDRESNATLRGYVM